MSSEQHEVTATLVASTSFVPPSHTGWTSTGEGAEALTEFVARVRTGTFDPPNPRTATTEGCVRTVVDTGDVDLLTHAHVTLFVENISITSVHELIRRPGLICTERHLGLAESERRPVPHVVQSDPVLSGLSESMGLAADEAIRHIRGASSEDEQVSDDTVDTLLQKKHALEALASMTPMSALTRVVMTASVATWRDVLKYCASQRASSDVRQVGEVLLRRLAECYPILFDSIG